MIHLEAGNVPKISFNEQSGKAGLDANSSFATTFFDYSAVNDITGKLRGIIDELYPF